MVKENYDRELMTPVTQIAPMDQLSPASRPRVTRNFSQLAADPSVLSLKELTLLPARFHEVDDDDDDDGGLND